MNDTRFPYTYSCNYIRSLAGYDENGTKLSRSDASKIRQAIAHIMDISDEELAIKLAEHYKNNEDKITQDSVEEFLRIKNINL